MKLWSIAGNSQKLDGGSMFGNAPRAMWTKWATPDALNRIPLATRALLATPLDGKTVLFETGIGAFFEPKLRERFGVQEARHVLLDSLREAGFDHADIDVVVLSHLHFDHAGGLLEHRAHEAAAVEPGLGRGAAQAVGHVQRAHGGHDQFGGVADGFADARGQALLGRRFVGVGLPGRRMDGQGGGGKQNQRGERSS